MPVPVRLSQLHDITGKLTQARESWGVISPRVVTKITLLWLSIVIDHHLLPRTHLSSAKSMTSANSPESFDALVKVTADSLALHSGLVGEDVQPENVRLEKLDRQVCAILLVEQTSVNDSGFICVSLEFYRDSPRSSNIKSISTFQWECMLKDAIND